jgi:LmbE family N-acetylglucosaminyl deacetylase
MKSYARPIYKLIKKYILRVILRTVKTYVPNIENSIIIITPHPDDEIFGMGGYLIRALKSEADVHIIYLTDGENSLRDIDPEIIRRERIGLSKSIAEQLNIPAESLYRLHLPDGAVPRRGHVGFDEAVEKVRTIVEKLRPGAVFVTHPLDTWPYDHIAAYEITQEALKRSDSDISLYAYWVWLWYSMPLSALGNINRQKTIRFNIAGELERKRELIDIYMHHTAQNGKPYSGILPRSMMGAFRYPYEVFEKIEISNNE